MKKFKNVLAIAAVIVMAFAMTACGAAPTVEEEPSDTVIDVIDEVTPDTEEPAVEAPAEEPAAEEPVVEEPVTEEPAIEEPAVEEPASSDLVFNFADLSHGGYGYVATVSDGAVNVSIDTQYQEIQYVLPVDVDLAQYTTLIVDVTSNSPLDIKLVNPGAEINQYGQLAPFHDGYTAEGQPITSPIYIDLAQFADWDLYQINFMAMGNGTQFTIKNITFVK